MVAISIVEAEYVVLANVTKEAVWLCILLSKLDFPQTTATVIHTDNQGCIALASNPVSYSWAKYIDIWYYFCHKLYLDHNSGNTQLISTI